MVYGNANVPNYFNHDACRTLLNNVLLNIEVRRQDLLVVTLIKYAIIEVEDRIET